MKKKKLFVVIVNLYNEKEYVAKAHITRVRIKNRGGVKEIHLVGGGIVQTRTPMEELLSTIEG